MKKVLIVGGGAAGMMAAVQAALKGNDVSIYEKNSLLGKKIYITGKGRCNLTNAGDIDDFLNNIPTNPYFLYSAFYSFDNNATIGFFNDLGVDTVVERGNRVFPVSQKAEDIVFALEKILKKLKVKIHLSTTVKDIIVENEKAVGLILTNDKQISADAVIITTGGLSYPGTGSTGDGYKFAKKLGHKITPLYPSLVPLKTKEKWCADLMGLSLKNVSIEIKSNKKKTLYKDFGEMLFTHFGVSGPIVLSASRSLVTLLDNENFLYIDLKPALDEKSLDQRILRDFEKYKNKDFKNSLNDLLPQKIIPIIIKLSGIDELKKIHDITKDERKIILNLIKNFPLTVVGSAGYNQAVITCGGVLTDEINPATMESKLIKDLYFAGEVLDIDGYTGGFNLQIAFSTGYVAGTSI